MPEKCGNDPCPLVPRVEALERANEQHGNTHREMYDRIRALETENAVQNAHWENANAKLDKLTSMVEELTGRAGKRWESLMGYVIAAIAGAFVLWIASGMPGVGG